MGEKVLHFWLEDTMGNHTNPCFLKFLPMKRLFSLHFPHETVSSTIQMKAISLKTLIIPIKVWRGYRFFCKLSLSFVKGLVWFEYWNTSNFPVFPPIPITMIQSDGIQVISLQNSCSPITRMVLSELIQKRKIFEGFSHKGKLWLQWGF